MVLEVVNGRHVGISPTELTVSLEEEEKPKSRVNKEKGKNRRNKKIMNTGPNPQKLDIDVNREGFFELLGLFESPPIIFGVHFIRERNLLMIADGEKPNLVDHAS